jgi:hypothetical protein
MKTTLKYWSLAQKTERTKEPSSLLLMRNVNNKSDKNLSPLKFSNNLLTFSRVLEGNVVPKNKFLEKNSIKEINKCTRNPGAHFYNYENLRNSRTASVV